MKKKTARNAAVEALLKTDEAGGYSNLVIDRTIGAYALSPRDAALAAGIFYGVLERKITLDYILSQYSKRSAEQTDAVTREILRAALYQLLYLDRIPESAAVNEAAESARAFGNAASAGFINGVLRAFLRGGKRFDLPKGREASLSVRYSLPIWLIRHFERDCGKLTAQAYFESLLSAPPVYLRVNPRKTTDDALIRALENEGIKAEKTALPGALITQTQGDLSACEAFLSGLFHIEDLSSQLACTLLAPLGGAVLTDVCSAPGGKAFTLAEMMEQGTVYAHDLYPQKIRLIEAGAERLGLTNLKASVRDARTSREGETSDFVLCDVPCSGLGVLRRKPEIRYKDPIEFRDLPNLQLSILENSARLLKPGGHMMYSTCTISKRENGAVVAKFLEKHPEFAPEALKLPPGFTRAIEEPAHEFTMFPHENGTDGFFAAKLRKIKEAEPSER